MCPGSSTPAHLFLGYIRVVSGAERDILRILDWWLRRIGESRASVLRLVLRLEKTSPDSRHSVSGDTLVVVAVAIKTRSRTSGLLHGYAETGVLPVRLFDIAEIYQVEFYQSAKRGFLASYHLLSFFAKRFRFCTIELASLMASMRLVGSAVPFPALPKLVP